MTEKRLPPSKLISAIRAARLSGVIAALNEGADIEEIDMHGHGGLPLRTACFEGNQAIVVELLKRGANPNASAADGTSAPVRLALRRGHTEIAALLIQHGARAPADQALPPEIQALPAAPSPDESTALALPDTPPDNIIEFTPSNLSFEKPGSVQSAAAETFGTETSGLSADLLFMEEDEIPPISWDTPAKAT